MKVKDIRELETKKIHERLADARGKLLKLTFGVTNRQVKDVREIRNLRKDIARMLTVIRDREHTVPSESKEQP